MSFRLRGIHQKCKFISKLSVWNFLLNKNLFRINDEWIQRPKESNTPSFQLTKNVSVKEMSASQRNALQDHVNFITKTAPRSVATKTCRKFSSSSSSRTSLTSASKSTWPLKPAPIVKEQVKRGRGRPKLVNGKRM